MLMLLLRLILSASGIFPSTTAPLYTAPLYKETATKKTAFNNTIPFHSILVTIPIHAPITLIGKNLAPNTTSVLTEGP